MIINLAIIDNDKEYLDKIKFNIENDYKNIRVDMFLSPYEYKENYEDKSYDLILINEEYFINEKETIDRYINYSNYCNKICKLFEKDKSQNFFKYQKLNDFVNKIIIKAYKNVELVKSDDDLKMAEDEENYCHKENEREELNDAKKYNLKKTEKKVITVYSPYGGIGKSKSAMRFAKNLSKYGNTFYLNLEMFSNLEERDKDGINLVNAVYNVDNLNNQKFKENLDNKGEGLYTFYPLENPYELLNISENDILKILSKIKESNFKYIIMDLDSIINRISLTLFNKSDLIFVLSDIRRLKMKRFNNLIKSLENYEDIKKKMVEINAKISDKSILEKMNKSVETLC